MELIPRICLLGNTISFLRSIGYPWYYTFHHIGDNRYYRDIWYIYVYDRKKEKMQKMYTKKYKKPQKIEDKCTPKIFIKKTQKQMFKKNAPGIKHPHIMCITLGNPWWMDPMSAHSWVQFPEWVRIPIFLLMMIVLLLFLQKQNLSSLVGGSFLWPRQRCQLSVHSDHQDVLSPVPYEITQTSDPSTRGYPADCTALALPGGPSELTPTVTKVIFVRVWFLPLCYNCTETMRIE